MRIIMRAPFDRWSGYGNDAVDLALALTDAGHDVVPWPTSVAPGLPGAFLRLLGKNPAPRSDVVLAFAPPYDLKPSAVGRWGLPVVGYSMWERSPLLVEDLYDDKKHVWDVEEERCGPSLAWMDALAVTCPMNATAFRPVWDDRKIHVVPCGIDPARFPVLTRTSRPTRFLMVGMLNGRKNPFALLETWRRITGEVPGWDATLHLHTLAPGLHPGICDGPYGPGITLSNRPKTEEEMLDMYRSADVLVSTSRGEGNNKPAMEFMATGGAVIATDWSGHQNWLHRDLGWPVAGSLVPAVSAPPGTVNFEVDRDSLYHAMVEAWKDPTETRRKGERSAAFIRSALAWDRVAPKLARVLERVR